MVLLRIMISALTIFRRLAVSRPRLVDWEKAGDAELALAARTQEREGKEAFVEIVRRHQNAVCAVAFSVTGRIGLTDDIAQETFLKAWNRIATLREPGKLKAWLARIAHDCAVDALRHERPHLSLEDETVSLTVAPGPSPDKAAADAEDEQLVWSALAALPETVRTPLVLFYREGQSVAAVAAALDLSEDAVKQRLSRGRNELREQVAAKVEGVLGRVRPSALLVVTIAAAIGLLASPAALAAGAFSTAAAGTASTGSAATASTFTTSMTASSYLVATITLAAFIPLGWKAREPEPSFAAVPVVQKSINPAEPFAAFPNSELLKEWRRLHEEHGSDAAAMPVLYQSIADIKDSFHRRALRSALLAEWAAVDPAAAFTFLTNKKQGGQALDMMREWLRLDAPAAAAHIVAKAASNPDMARSLLYELVEAAPDQLGAVVAMLPATIDGYQKHVEDAFAALARKGPAAARAAAELVTGTHRAQALAGAAGGWAEKDGAAALAWSKSLPEGEERDGALRATVIGWAKSDPLAALTHMDAAPPGRVDSSFASDTSATVLRAAAEKDLPATLEWLTANTGKVGRESWLGLTDAVGKRLADDPAGTCTFLMSQPESLRDGLQQTLHSIMLNDGYKQKAAVWDWLQTQPAGTTTDGLRTMMLSCAAWKEPEQAMRWLSAFPETPVARATIESSLHQLMSEGRDLPELDALLAHAPEQLRGGLLAIAMRSEGSQQMDIRPWAERLPQLPEADRPRAAEALAGRMAAANPQDALTWAGSQPEGEQRLAAYRGLTMSWANVEPEAASVWVRDLPAGTERDAAAGALTAAIASTDPEAAWVWAGSIGDAQAKLSALSSAAEGLHRRDPQRARQMLQAGQLSDDERIALQTILGSDAANPAPAR